MKNMYIIFTSVTLLAVSACDSNVKTTQPNAVQESKKSVVANKVLSVELDGMVCEKGCGSSIRKELKATGGVTECSFDFEDGRKVNTASIQFNKDEITADEIVNIINTMNEKQFHVLSSSTSNLETNVAPAVEESTNSKKSETPKIRVTESNFEMPNLLKLFSKLIRQD